MGHKVHPKIHRMPVLFPWTSRWVMKTNYADTVREDIQMREFLQKKGKDAQIDSIHIERSAKNVTITIFSAKPGVLIGRGGQGLDLLRKNIERRRDQRYRSSFAVSSSNQTKYGTSHESRRPRG